MQIASRQIVVTPSEAYATVTRRLLPRALDGSQGENRGTGRAQIVANTDLDALETWLRQFDNAETVQAYHKEVMRFYVWVLVQLGKPLSSLVYEDWEEYQVFLKDPQPAELWVGSKRGRGDQYKPFARRRAASPGELRGPGGLAPGSIDYARNVIALLFSWMTAVGYLAGNPITVARRRSQPQQRRRLLARALTDEQWRVVMEHIDEMPQESRMNRLQRARARFTVSLFYLTGIRTSEGINALMQDVHSIRDREQQCDRHFLTVVGKGNKERLVPMPADLCSELRLYRQAFGLSPWPKAGESIPLLFSVRTGAGFQAITRQALFIYFKGIFRAAAEKLKSENEEAALRLEEASTHWMRHTAATEMLNSGVTGLAVRDGLGHADLSTTNIYLHTEALKNHREVSELHRLNWPPASADKQIEVDETI